MNNPAQATFSQSCNDFMLPERTAWWSHAAGHAEWGYRASLRHSPVTGLWKVCTAMYIPPAPVARFLEYTPPVGPVGGHL